MKIIDAHSHLDYITHNHQPDVIGTVCCTVQENQWHELVDMIKRDNCIYGAFGIHPWFIDSVTREFDNQLEQLLNTDSCYMVGEIGLDKYKPNMDTQIDVFLRQFNIAVKLHRTVFLHCVGAWDKILYILKQYKQSELPTIVAHAFNANDTILQQLLRYNNIIYSFNKINVSSEKSCIQQIPKNRIVVESDGNLNSSLIQIIKNIIDIKFDENMPNIIYDNMQRIIKHG